MNVRSPTMALAIAVCLFGLALGLFLNVLQAQGPQVMLEPSFVQLVEDPREYQPVSLPFQLHNPTRSPIIVRQASALCNCMSVVTRGGLPMLAPITIPPGGSLPWRVDLVTARRGGPEEYFFRVECLVNGRPKELTSRIAINVQAGWRADPPALSAVDVRPFDEVSHEVALFDGYGEQGFRVAEVRVSNPDRLTANLMPVDLSQQPTAKTLVDGGVKLPQRYRLMVTMRSGDEGELRQETITLVSGEPNHPNLDIPVSCRSQPRTYELIPENELCLLLLPILLGGFLWSNPSLTFLRYLLPIYPPLMVSLGRMTGTHQSSQRWLRMGIIAVGMTTLAPLVQHPHYLGYFNLVAGGPGNCWPVFADSEVDWGQDLYLLKRWQQAHPDARPMRLALFTPFRPPHPRLVEDFDSLTDQKLSSRGPLDVIPERPEPGYLAISITFLNRGAAIPKQPHDVFAAKRPFLHWLKQTRTPLALLGTSILIYRLTDEDATDWSRSEESTEDGSGWHISHEPEA